VDAEASNAKTGANGAPGSRGWRPLIAKQEKLVHEKWHDMVRPALETAISHLGALDGMGVQLLAGQWIVHLSRFRGRQLHLIFDRQERRGKCTEEAGGEIRRRGPGCDP